MYPDTMPTHPVGDVKMSSPGPYMLPPTTYQPPGHSSTEQVPMLDSTPISGGNRTTRSPRFTEHISEMVLKQLLEAFNAHDVDAVMGFFVDDCILEMPRGPEPWVGG